MGVATNRFLSRTADNGCAEGFDAVSITRQFMPPNAKAHINHSLASSSISNFVTSLMCRSRLPCDLLFSLLDGLLVYISAFRDLLSCAGDRVEIVARR